MKNVLNVVGVFFSVPYFFGDQFLYFKNKGYKMHLICSPSQFLKQYAEEQQIIYKEIPILRKISPFTDIVSLFKICLFIKINDIEVVVGHNAKGSLLALLAARIMNVPYRIYFRHGSLAPTKVGLSRKIVLIIDRFVAKCSTKIVCVSPSLYDLCIEDKLNSASKQMLLGKGTCGGIDTINKFNPDLIRIEDSNSLRQKLNLPQNAFVIGYSGRLVRDKGIAELVEGFDILRAKHPYKVLYLLLVGLFEDGDALSDNVKNIIKADENIIYTGYIKNKIELYYSLMSMLILPSYREGFPTCVLEASAMRLPVLTTKSLGCIDSIIENETGNYIKITPESISEGIESYFDNELRKKLGYGGRSWVVNNFDNLLIWPEIEKLYI